MKKSELEKKIKELEETVQKLLLFNNNITRLCFQDFKSKTVKLSEEEKEVAEFFFMFNIHSFTSYFAKDFMLNNKKLPVLKIDEIGLTKWNNHVQNVLNPIFDKEVVKIREKYNPKKEAVPYVI